MSIQTPGLFYFMRLRQCAMYAALLLGMLIPVSGVRAQGFAVYISPPLYELKGKPGQTLRQIVEITSTSRISSGIKAYTADWRLNVDGSALFVDTLEPDSCRPWVAVERREFRLAPFAKYRFRFEVSVPSDAPAGECRFALMFEGADPIAVAAMSNLPLAARVAVIVYVAIGDARPSLQVIDRQVRKTPENPLGALLVRNSGQAHGRMGGFLEATDATGRRFEVTPSQTPILPTQDALVALQIPTEDRPGPAPVLPVRIQGSLEWEGGSIPVDVVVRP